MWQEFSVLHFRQLDNCLLCNDGQIKITDFGLATRVSAPALLAHRCGTPEYSPPEMFWDAPYAPYPVDVWAMGVILFAMLVGKMPFASPQDTNAVRYRWPHGSHSKGKLVFVFVKILVILAHLNSDFRCEGAVTEGVLPKRERENYDCRHEKRRMVSLVLLLFLS